MTTSHKVLWAVVITYFIGVSLGVYAIIKDPTNVGMVLGYIGGVAAVGIGFYSWKAKAENIIKLSKKQLDKLSNVPNIEP